MREKDPVLHCNPDVLKPIRKLIQEEKDKVSALWDNPKVPKMKYMQELDKDGQVTWTN